jgi:hypothetical protein
MKECKSDWQRTKTILISDNHLFIVLKLRKDVNLNNSKNSPFLTAPKFLHNNLHLRTNRFNH